MRSLSNTREFSLQHFLVAILVLFSIIGISAELLGYHKYIVFYKPVVIALVITLYSITSSKKAPLFFIISGLIMLTSICVLFDTKVFRALAFICLISSRVFLFTYIIKLSKIKDYFPIVLGSVPFIFIFSYLLFISDDFKFISYYSIVIQNFLVSIIVGLILSIYMMNHNQSTTAWLYIFGLLYLGLYFSLFIEKCFLVQFPIASLPPIALALYVGSYYSFYRFVIHAEKNNLPQ